jgi:hypothetical protein
MMLIKMTVIGTIKTDILENRKTVINLKKNYIALNLSTEDQYDFKKNYLILNKKKENYHFWFVKWNRRKFLFDWNKVLTNC